MDRPAQRKQHFVVKCIYKLIIKYIFKAIITYIVLHTFKEVQFKYINHEK